MTEKSPIDFFRLFFSEQVLNLIETETRQYTEQYLRRESDYLQQHPKARAHEWKRFPLTRKELEVFLALIIAMGVCGFPTLRCVYMYMLACAYWNVCKCVHTHRYIYTGQHVYTQHVYTKTHVHQHIHLCTRTHIHITVANVCKQVNV